MLDPIHVINIMNKMQGVTVVHDADNYTRGIFKTNVEAFLTSCRLASADGDSRANVSAGSNFVTYYYRGENKDG